MRTILVLLSLVGTITLHAECTGERWPVKAAADTDANSIGTLALPTSIEFLHLLPKVRPLPHNRRVAPIEYTTYALTATLMAYRFGEDGSIELVLADSEGRTSRAELPPVECANDGRFAWEIDAARRAFTARFQATSEWQSAVVPIELHGVAFFDFLRGERGMATNGVTLSPVTFLNLRLVVPAPIPPSTARNRPAIGSLCVPPSLSLQSDTADACSNAPVMLTWQSSDPFALVTIDGAGESFAPSGTSMVTANEVRLYSAHATNACGDGPEVVRKVDIHHGGIGSVVGNDTLVHGTTTPLTIRLKNVSSWTLSSTLGNSLSLGSGTQSGTFVSTYTATHIGEDVVTLDASGPCGPIQRQMTILVEPEPLLPPFPVQPLQPPIQTRPSAPTSTQPDRIRCCDGSLSSCTVGGDNSGCCSHNGGICAGSEDSQSL